MFFEKKLDSFRSYQPVEADLLVCMPAHGARIRVRFDETDRTLPAYIILQQQPKIQNSRSPKFWFLAKNQGWGAWIFGFLVFGELGGPGTWLGQLLQASWPRSTKNQKSNLPNLNFCQKSYSLGVQMFGFLSKIYVLVNELLDFWALVTWPC